MKKISLLTLALILVMGVVVACTSNGSTNNPTNATTATATPTTLAVVVAATVGTTGSFNFVPATSTITHGQAVVWNSTLNGSHTVQIDNNPSSNGTGCGTTPTNYTSFPITITFPTAGTYYYHCTNHSSCASGGCGTCVATPGASSGIGNMAGSIVVN